MANPTTAQTGRLADDLSALSPTIIQKEILETAETYNRTRPLVHDFKFEGPGLVTTLPYMQELAFASTAEAVAAAYSEPDVDADSVTLVKYTLDAPISMEARSFSAATGDGLLNALKAEGARAYAKSVTGLILAEVVAGAAVANRVDTGGTLTLAHLFEASENLLAAGAPEPYYAVIAPSEATAILDPGATALANLAGLDYRDGQFLKGASPNGYIGNIANLNVVVDPNVTTATGVFFAGEGVWWARKDATIPGQTGEMTVEVSWDREIRAWVLSLTYFGAAKVRRAGNWAGRLYDVP